MFDILKAKVFSGQQSVMTAVFCTWLGFAKNLLTYVPAGLDTLKLAGKHISQLKEYIFFKKLPEVKEIPGNLIR